MSRVAVVTGGTRGIGGMVSEQLKNKGYTVAAVYGGNDEAAQKFNADTGIAVYKIDVSDFDACAAGIAQIDSDEIEGFMAAIFRPGTHDRDVIETLGLGDGA